MKDATVILFGRFLGSSGQPVNDIYKFSKLDDRLDILEKTLNWCHLAPTAPDTLGNLLNLFNFMCFFLWRKPKTEK